jgi:hypothetical protein
MKRRKVNKKDFVDSNAGLFFCTFYIIKKIHSHIVSKSWVKYKKSKKKYNKNDKPFYIIESQDLSS